MTEQEAINIIEDVTWKDGGRHPDYPIAREMAIVALERQGNLRKIASELMKKNYKEDEYNYFQKGIQALVVALEKEE